MHAPEVAMPHTYIKRILNARVYDVAQETPLDVMQAISTRIGNRVLLKREDLQPVFSFKLRGAYNKMRQLSAEALERGRDCGLCGQSRAGFGFGRMRAWA
jgi:threonine dehydratase